MSLLAIFLLLIAIASSSSLFVCRENHCQNVQCVEVTNCSGANQIVKPGGFCSCCNVCHTILGENETCAEQFLIGGPPPTATCAENLVCYAQKCQKVENVDKYTNNNNDFR